ncbi:Cyclopropane-fatty-acyl-phospholipid synthase [Rhynchospora pubera]|uniref:Cyclopropane-fatty-acyl-phospholipid synthase n=1 Tax=Rhynchospora pubera TaxID=906938 RepID=A0AAV8E587_9POAL|nr:Cyclopropane-fatty-acyl-phospholipid synthase [Rhynchospora pubera]
MGTSINMTTSLIETGARLLATRFLRQYVRIGTIVLHEHGGMIIEFGEPSDKCRVKSIVRVHNSSFYFKIAAEADIGLANAYINEYFSFDDQEQGLLDLLLVLIANRDLRNANPSKRGWWTPLLVTAGFASAKYFFRHVWRKNAVTQTRRNISQHYDLSNDFFSLFLDETMSYSCGIFKTQDEDLKTAQLNKISSLIDKARVSNEHAVLEIGCGWGSLAIELVKRTGCNYTGITLSEEQLKYAERKVKEAGLEDQIKFILCDYRQVPCSHKFDRIISCEMIEHVGHEYMDEFFGCCESLLAEDGLLVLQFTSMPDSRYNGERRSSGFVAEYIFPGGCIPSLSRVTAAMSTSSKLCVEHVENIGIHYYATLLRWRSNFTTNKQEIIGLGFDERFIRMWDYYLVYCMAGFKSRTLGNYQMVFSRPGNTKALGDHPTFSSKPKVA